MSLGYHKISIYSQAWYDGFHANNKLSKIFPMAITVKSNKPIISRRHYLLESLLAHLKVT